MSSKTMLSFLGDLRTSSLEKLNPPSYSEWLSNNTLVGGAPMSFARHHFQVKIINDLHPNMDVIKCSQVGLALCLNTPIMTQKGWKTMGTLVVGDYIYAPDSSWTRVTYLSPVYPDRRCYALSIIGGEKIIADQHHRWPTNLGLLNTEYMAGLVEFDNLYIEVEGLYKRRIRDIVRVDSVPVRCLTVDHPSHLFLCGTGLIPTHNTEIQYRKALAIAKRNPQRTIMFTLPDDDMRKRLVQTRVQPLLTSCPIFHPAEGDKPVRSVEVTQIGSSFVLFVPCNEKAATSQPADMVLNDEVDLSSQEYLALFNSRMQASDWRINQRFSTPTFTGFGISATFENSDQHLYLYRCRGCGLHQHPEFTREFCTLPGLPDHIEHLHQLELSVIDKYNLNLSEAFMHCKQCRKPMDLTDPKLREWVPKYPSRLHHRGYRVSPFCVSTIPPEYIFSQLLSYKERDFMRGWFNTVLGLAHDGGNNRLTPDEVRVAYTGNTAWIAYDPLYAHFIGVDMGQTCNIVVGRTLVGDEVEVCLFTTCSSDVVVDQVCQLTAQYQCHAGHVDRQPYEPTAKEILRATSGIVVPCEYGQGEPYSLRQDLHGDLAYVRVNRTSQLDYVADSIRSRRLTLSGYGNQEEVVTEHLRDMVREETAEKQATWEKLTGRDHYFHAIGYMLQALKQNFVGALKGERKGSIIYLGGVSSKNKPKRLLGY
jgi:hypothetical protein